MSIINLNTPYYYYDLTRDLNDFANKYKNIAKLAIIGSSHDNRLIPMLRIGTGDKAVLFTAGVHARETINTIVLMKIIEDILIAYTNCNTLWGYNLEKLLKEVSLYFIPLLNPDGYMVSLMGFSKIRNYEYQTQAKNLNIPYQYWKYNARGIDINRNFPAKSFKVKFENDTPASENETQALINVFHSMPIIGYIDFHSRGKEIFYHRAAMPKEYNDRQLELAEKLSEITGYTLSKPEEEIGEGDSGGNTVQYFSETFAQPALTVETVFDEAKFVLPLYNQDETYSEIKTVPISFAQMLLDS